MASTTDLTRARTHLPSEARHHLQRLVSSWGLLADLSFADLLLFTAVTRTGPGSHPAAEPAAGANAPAERFVVIGQVRPLTSQTIYRGDQVATEVTAAERPNVARCWELGEIIDHERTHPDRREPVRELCVPVRLGGRTVAVLTRETPPSVGRPPGELERTYVEVFNRLVRMISAGAFPYRRSLELDEEAPRVGDGALVLDGAGRVEYASPNAVSALHRVGVHANTEGMRLNDLGLHESAVRTAFAKHAWVTDEVERSDEVTVQVHCLPLLDHGQVTGAMVLLRDISELRRRDRLLMSKDATIREIHHRVKNNLQTISSLLRLQGRRLSSPEAKAAIEESVRRIRSIALVHETLSHEAGDDVPFDDIVRPLVRMVEEGLMSPEHPVRIRVTGDAGMLPATTATSLAVVLNELLQNVVDHAFPSLPAGERDDTVVVELTNDEHELRVRVVDDGVGVPEGFDPASSTSLGLSIVSTLVVSELQGTITIRRGEGAGDRPGTGVESVAPLGGRPEPITGVVPVVQV